MDAELEAWWKRTQGSMTEILYRHDPDGIGSSVGRLMTSTSTP